MTPQHSALTFEGLVAAIGNAHAMLAQQATKAVNISLTLRNWFIGFYIAEFELQGTNRAGYGDRLIPELVVALKTQNVSSTGRRQLYTYLAFYRAYPQIVRTAPAQSIELFPSALLEEKVRTLSALSPAEPAIDPEKLLSQLSYSHFEQLLELTDLLKRRFYEIEALRGNWSVRELRRQIDSQYFELIELKNDAFKHEHLGQLNSYVSYYKANQMQDSDQPPIGILLCTRKNHELVEYALAGMSNKIFVSRYQMELPGKEEIVAFLHRAVEELEGIGPKAPRP